MTDYKYLFSIDWLQLFCHREFVDVSPTEVYTSPRADMFGNHRDYRLRPAREYLHGWRQQWRVCYKQYDVATIAYDHVDERVRRDAASIKAANAILYVADWRFILEDIMLTFRLHPQNITRCDLCCDFNRFFDLDPRVFMRRYLADRSPKFDTYTRVGSNHFAINGQRVHDHVEVETIRWGSRQNGVSTYMYNKSLELQAHNYKRYIVEAWKRAGIVYNDPAHPVWRVEFSISSKGVALRDLELDEVKSLWLNDFDEPSKVRELFKVFAAKFFHFKVIPPVGERLVKKQNLADLVLFRWDDPLPLRPVTLCVSVDSGRTERMIAKHLQTTAEDVLDRAFMCSDDKTREALSLQDAANIYARVANVKSWSHDFSNYLKINKLGGGRVSPDLKPAAGKEVLI